MAVRNVEWILRAAVVAAMLVLSIGRANGQETETEPSDSGGTSIIPFPFLFYTPETETGVGATVITMFRFPGGEQEQSSRISPILVYTKKKQLVAIMQAELYFGSGKYRLAMDGGYSRFPNTIWGIGNDTPDALEEDYTPEAVYLNTQFQRRLAQGWYAGVRVEYAHRKLVETDSLGLLAAAALPGTADGKVMTGGLMVTWDTRDNAVYPTRGGFRQIQAFSSNTAIGSDYDFSRYTVDVRQYVSVTEGQILAVRGLGVSSSGTQPFDVLPQLGGEILLRGYYGGRYRDRNLFAAQAEYRAHIWKRIGAIGFLSAGRVAGTLGDMDFTGWKPSGGFGLRILLAPDEGLNLRADFGFANGSTGFYLGMGEVF